MPRSSNSRFLEPSANARLSRREREILQWVAYGKTSYEISIIVGLSERTVNFHVAGAIAKLNAANRTHAAVKAALMGLITVD
ncbi:LuxR C-terminal-related transcriptional regulator [Dyella sp.]|uniref:LuxR C-terminal-related transcriptional regulator n=1 Tax=Dyella sp. TaxID=1869338 RepID=UPI002FDACA53